MIPSYLSSAPLTHDPVLGWQTTGALLNIPAMFIVAVMTVLLVIGIKESAVFNNIIVLVKLSVLLLFITFGIAYIKTGNWIPFIPPNTGDFGHFGWSGILRGAGVIFFAYFGFDAVSTAAQEARNPKKDMPIGILSSLAISTVLYIIVSLVLTGLVKYDQLLVPAPIAVAVNAAGPGLFWLRPFIKIGAIAGLSSVVLVLLLSQPRIFYTMAKDGLLPKIFSSVHPKFKTPYITTSLTGIAAMVVAGLFPIEILGALVSIGTLLAFAIVCLSVLVLRKTQPDLPRPFKTPFLPWVPVLGALFSFAQMISLPVDTWLRLLIWMGIGLVIYVSYSRRHSKVRSMGTGS
jgi:APA family basic amino acid/polyamine antiporter